MDSKGIIAVAEAVRSNARTKLRELVFDDYQADAIEVLALDSSLSRIYQMVAVLFYFDNFA